MKSSLQLGNQSTMAERTDVFILSQVAQHKSKKDCWLVVNGRVLNVTNFLKEHPGGEEVILESAGKDVTKEFQDMGHSRAAQSLLLQYQVGVLQGCQAQDPADYNASNMPLNGPPAKKEMSAFVIKDESASKHAALLEFFIPLWSPAPTLPTGILPSSASSTNGWIRSSNISSYPP